jgi:hypothetical protein
MYFLACANQQSPSESSAESATTAMLDTALNADRFIIKTADISLDVDNVESSIQNVQKMITDVSGHIYHVEINNEKHFQQEVQYSLDSSVVINEMHPEALLKVKIPVAYADTFLSQMLVFDGMISRYYFDENDITEDITEKKELMLTDAVLQTKKRTQQTIEENYFDREKKQSFIKQKAAFSALAYKSNMLWFDITLHGKSYQQSQTNEISKTSRTPFYVNAINAVDSGWYGFSLFLTFLLQLWPFILLGLFIFYIIKKKWHKIILPS